jgi:hypothetical protein
MKLRIQDSSIRFRVTLREVETLLSNKALTRECRLPTGDVFLYGVRIDDHAPESTVQLAGTAMTLILTAADAQSLADSSKEGVYIHREWSDQEGRSQRFMVFIEKDRPGSTCTKPEAWIYDGHSAQEPIIRPIPRP